MTLVDPSGIAALAGAYPLSPAMLRHGLAGHPLLGLEALAAAARRLPAAHVERRIGNAGRGGDFAMDRPDADDAGAMIRDIARGSNWIMLRFIEQLPEYDALLRALVCDIAPAVAPRTGPPATVKGFMFVSASDAQTPFHFDAEYNILFQIAGDKRFATYPSAPPFLSLAQREAYHRAGRNMLPWQEEFRTLGQVHRLAPGDALYVPHAAPHWVEAGAGVSVSLSLTWQGAWSMRAAEALAFNPVLRRLRLPAGDVPAWPAVPRWRALGHRIARRAGLT